MTSLLEYYFPYYFDDVFHNLDLTQFLLKLIRILTKYDYNLEIRSTQSFGLSTFTQPNHQVVIEYCYLSGFNTHLHFYIDGILYVYCQHNRIFIGFHETYQDLDKDSLYMRFLIHQSRLLTKYMDKCPQNPECDSITHDNSPIMNYCNHDVDIYEKYDDNIFASFDDILSRLNVSSASDMPDE